MNFFKRLFGTSNADPRGHQPNDGRRIMIDHGHSSLMGADDPFTANLFWQGYYSGDGDTMFRLAQDVLDEFRALYPGAITVKTKGEGSKQPDGRFLLILSYPSVRARDIKHAEGMMGSLERLALSKGFTQED